MYGCILEDDNLMKANILSKRAQFIVRVKLLLQELHFVDSSTMIGLIRTYVTFLDNQPIAGALVH